MNEYQWHDEDTFRPQPVTDIIPTNTKKEKKSKPWLLSLIIAIAASLLTMLVCFLMIYFVPAKRTRPEKVENTGPAGITVAPSTVDSSAASSALASVVNIQSAGDFSGFGGFFSQPISMGNGSGAIIRDDGYILTSAYALESSGNITVTLHDGTSYEAEVYQVDSTNNAALLKINASGLTPIVVGDSSAVQLGDSVAAIGNTLNSMLSNPITFGTVSGINNGVPLQNGQKVNIFQIDASTIADSVGGLILNKDGQLVGITTSMISNSSSEIGLATPINDLKSLLSNIVTTDGSVASGLTIGISGTDASYGVAIDTIGEGTPAEKAGLKSGDLVVKVDGETVSSINDINTIKGRHQKGDTIVFTIYRDGEMIDINIILE